MSSNQISLKICTPADLHTLCALAEATYREAFAPFNTPEDMELYVQTSFSPTRMAQELANPQSVFVLALQNGQPTGYIKLNYGEAQTELQDARALEIERIYVLQQYQSRRIGQQLLDYAVQRATGDRLDYLWLGVWERNPGAIRFYQRNGFVRFGQHVFYLGTDKQTDYMLRKDLLLV